MYLHPCDQADKCNPNYLCGNPNYLCSNRYNTWRMGPYNCWNKYTTYLPRLPKVPTVPSKDAWGLGWHPHHLPPKSQGLTFHH